MKKHKPSPSNIFKNLRETPSLNKKRGLIVIIAFAIIGSIFLFLSHAATPTANIQPETGTVASPAITGSDTNASGGSYVQFKAAGTGGGGGTNCGINTVGTCAPIPVAPLAAGKTWKLPFDEEFSGTDYDHSHLKPCFDWDSGGCTASFDQGREQFAASQVVVGNGIARLIATPHSPSIANSACLGGQCTYLSGMLSTARPLQNNGSDYLFKFTYGYVESRLKVAGTQGFTSAFWMLPAVTNFSYPAEIDILEQFGGADRATTMNMTYLEPPNRQAQYEVQTGALKGRGGDGACPVKDYTTDYHTMGMDWEPTFIAFYIDGQKCGQTPAGAPIYSQPMQLIMDLIVDHQFARNYLNEPFTGNGLTREFDIDYLRVYQQQ
jgi:hypothetical protein